MFINLNCSFYKIKCDLLLYLEMFNKTHFFVVNDLRCGTYEINDLNHYCGLRIRVHNKSWDLYEGMKPTGELILVLAQFPAVASSNACSKAQNPLWVKHSLVVKSISSSVIFLVKCKIFRMWWIIHSQETVDQVWTLPTKIDLLYEKMIFISWQCDLDLFLWSCVCKSTLVCMHILLYKA